MSGETYQFLTEFINQGRYLAQAEANHQTWMDTKHQQGWQYGPTRDNEAKMNPLLVPFASLPAAVRGQNCLTPYAVVNFFRVQAGETSLAAFKALLAALLAGEQPALVEQLGEYVHSHFIAGQLSKGETPASRDDMLVYEDLSDEVKSWDTELALDIVRHLHAALPG